MTRDGKAPLRGAVQNLAAWPCGLVIALASWSAPRSGALDLGRGLCAWFPHPLPIQSGATAPHSKTLTRPPTFLEVRPPFGDASGSSSTARAFSSVFWFSTFLPLTRLRHRYLASTCLYRNGECRGPRRDTRPLQQRSWRGRRCAPGFWK